MCGKKCFKKREADGALRQNENNHHRGYRREVRRYFCEECQCWHLTSKPEKEEDMELKVPLSPEWNKFLITEE